MLKSATNHAAHLLMEALLGIAGVLAFAGIVLAWRLAQGPIDITWLVHRAQHLIPTEGTRISLGSAALAWEGFHDPDSPLDIRWRDLAIADRAGAELARLPAGRLTLSAAALWQHAIAPRTLEVDDASVTLQRDRSGALRLDLANRAGGSPAAAAAPHPGRALALLGGLTKPGAYPFLAQLQRVRLRHASVTLRDDALGVSWLANAGDILLARQRDGSVRGEAALALAVGDAGLLLTVAGVLSETGMQITAGTSALSPALLARNAPPLAALAAIEAPLTLGLRMTFDPGFGFASATIAAQLGAGTVRAGRGQVAIASAHAVAATDGKTTYLNDLRIVLRPPPGARAAAPTITGHADAHQAADGRMRTSFAVAIDRAAFADLASYWPPGAGGGAQAWITRNVTDGMIRAAHAEGTVASPADFSDASLTALSGGFTATDMTLHWLRPVPPIEHADATLTLDGPDVLHIDVARAVQGSLALSAGTIRITGLAANHQVAAIGARITGQLAEALRLLNHPRIRLLSRRPIPLRDPAGDADVRLRVNLPLEARVTFDDIGIGATARLAGVHLGGIAAGRDLDDGRLDLTVDTNALGITGTGRVASVPATLAVAMDFRDGPPTQVLQRLSAQGRATAAQLQTFGAPASALTGGTAGFDVTYASARNGSGSVAVALDLQQAALATPLGWTKPAGATAHIAGRVRLRQDHLVGVDQIQAAAPGLAVSAHAAMAAGRGLTVTLDQLRLGGTVAHGTITTPSAADPRLLVSLRGPSLDLSAYLKQRDSNPGAAPDEDKPGLPWAADLAFDEVILAQDERLAPASFRGDDDGVRMRHLDVSAGPAGTVRASIEPSASGRTLKVDAADAGAVMLAAGVADNIRGGKLRIDGSYDDRAPHAPLNGTATLAGFRITDAPAVARLLKAVTLYGAVDLLRGPGMGFQKAVVPFRYQQRVLHMQGARAFSASLGVTAQGNIDLRHHTADVKGTIVPAYFFNQLLGKIPLLGQVFSPEKGGGVFAARYSVKGKLGNPQVGINPLSALTPGFLREVFGLF